VTNTFDRRRFLYLSAVSAGGSLLPAARLGAVPQQPSSGGVPITLEETPSAVVLHQGTETVRITVCAPDVIHVVAGPGHPAGASPHTPWFIGAEHPQRPEVTRAKDLATLRTSRLSVEIDLKTALLRFLDAEVRCF
jgi:hypothetical protein